MQCREPQGGREGGKGVGEGKGSPCSHGTLELEGRGGRCCGLGQCCRSGNRVLQ